MNSLLGPHDDDAPSPSPELDGELVRMIFTAGALLALVAAGAIATLAMPVPEVPRNVLTALTLLLAALLWWGRARADSRHARGALVVMAWAASMLVMLVAGLVGSGLRTISLAVMPLMVCMLAVVGSRRHALALAGGGALGLALVTLAQYRWRPDLAAHNAAEPLYDALIAHAVVLLTALVLGIAVARIAERHRRRAAERENRFVALLGIAADAYWETDAQLDLQVVWRRSARGEFEPLDIGRGHKAWNLPTLQFDEDVAGPLRATMQARQRIREVPLRHIRASGRVIHLVANGEPRLDANGKFIGYWGLVTDITEEVEAKRSVRVSEARYRHLFDATPTPLMVHRDGLVLQANAAVARLLGYPDAEGLVGASMSPHLVDDADRALLAQRAAQAATLPLGASLPMAAYRARRRDGALLWLRSTMARVQTDEGPALLSMFIDETERRDAEEAARRNQALLERVVATSPDVITLTDLASGRYEMVNATFCRVTGYAEQDVIGRSALELGIWRSEADRERLVDELRRSDMVSDMALEFVGRHGQLLPMRVAASRFELDGRPYLVINARDTSEADRSRLERAAILDNASIGIAFTRERRFLVVNKRFEQMLGWPPGELLGLTTQVALLPGQDYEQMVADFAVVLTRGGLMDREQVLRRRDGSTFVARLLARAIDPDKPAVGGTVWIVDDVTEKRQVERALAKARDDAEAASRAKSAFLANTSHEIRTPLNGLVGLARLAREPNLDDARRRQYLDQIGESAEALSAIISDILDLSKIEAGKLVLESVPFDLHELMGALHQAYAALADSRGLGLALQLDAALPRMVRGDALRVRQILANYLSNGLKFTGQGGLLLRAGPTDVPGRVRFEVHDSGPGIDAITQARLFQPFTQADDSTTRRFGGTGLGLSICRELAGHMGGEVGMVSTPGQGSVFWAELPLPVADVTGKDSDFGGLDSDPLQGARVLLVEDNPVNMMIGVALIERWGAQVEQASDGAQAVEMALRAAKSGAPFDLVLMDIQMPGMSGHEATRTLRRYFSHQQLGIVALTAAALVSERETAVAAGMDGFVTKPIDERRLHGALVRVLARRAGSGTA